MVDNRKQNVSVRMNGADLRRIKDIAQRLNVRDSDVFRFAVKNTLARLMPLSDAHVRGRDLLPVFVSGGADLTSYFDLDTARLEKVINSGVDDPGKLVDRGDIELLVMAGIQENYAYIRLKHILRTSHEQQGVGAALKEYLLEKYISRCDGGDVKALTEPA